MSACHDVVIIGAGISGLTAASKCLDAGINKVLVLEARDRDVDGKVVDMGGMWINQDSQRNISGLVDSLGLTVIDQYDKGKRIMQLDQEVIKNYSGDIPNVSLFGLIDAQLASMALDRMANRLSPAAISDASKSLNNRERAWDAISVGHWARKTLWTAVGTKIMDIAVRAVVGLEPEQVSLLWFLRYIRCAGSFGALIDTQQAQKSRIKEGAQSVSKRLASRLTDSQIRLCAPVVQIDRSAADNIISIYVAGDTYPIQTKAIIFAIPPSQHLKLKWTPALPAKKLHYFHRTAAVGYYTKVCLIYDEPFWRSAGVSGQAISHTGPICMTFDSSDDAATYGSMTVFLTSHQGQQWAALSDEDRKQGVLDHMVRLYKDERFGKPKLYEEQDWAKEEFSGGCPVHFMAPGTLTSYSKEIFEPIGGNIFFAGTETASIWPGYMDGAVEAGKRAGQEAVDFLHSLKSD
ncbi:hypothetical protein DFJ73DRAFT_855411 [Zopfochytrium polystomum]|nr:hypothetical protein DFJ73DRAFT_855411 [Zopfochytrium polystomum]